MPLENEVSRIMEPKDVHIPILGICEYGKRDFADMVNIMDHEMGRVSWIIQVAQI